MDFFAMLHEYQDIGIISLRVAIAWIFFAHAFQKMKMWKMKPSKEISANQIGVLRGLSIVEPVAGMALLIGLATPVAAFMLGVIMIGAIWMKISAWHMPLVSERKAGWDLDLMILAGCIALIFFGGGSFSIDALLMIN